MAFGQVTGLPWRREKILEEEENEEEEEAREEGQSHK